MIEFLVGGVLVLLAALLFLRRKPAKQPPGRSSKAARPRRGIPTLDRNHLGPVEPESKWQRGPTPGEDEP